MHNNQKRVVVNQAITFFLPTWNLDDMSYQEALARCAVEILVDRTHQFFFPYIVKLVIECILNIRENGYLDFDKLNLDA